MSTRQRQLKQRQLKQRKTRERKTRERKIKQRKTRAKGKSVSKNRQVSAFFKEQGTLSYKVDGKTYEMKIQDDVIEQIDKILEKEFKKQVITKNILLKKLKPHKDDIKELDEFYKENGYDEHERENTITFLKGIEELHKTKLEEFDTKNIKKMEKKVNTLIDTIQHFFHNNLEELYNDNPSHHQHEIDLIEEILERSHNQ